MRNYTPRRFGARWRDATTPEYVLDVFDNKGATADRYTVMFTGLDFLPAAPREFCDTRIQYLSMSANPTHAQGVSLWCEAEAYQAAGYRYRSAHHRIRWIDLPENVRAHVISRATED